MMDRYRLRYFLAVLERGNFTRAAEHCGVAQATLSIGIAKLEAELSCRLFERTNRRVAPTDAGLRFAVHARRIEAEFANAAASVEGPARRDKLRLGVLGSLPASLLERSLNAELFAGHDLEIVEGRPADLTSLLDRSRLDAILTVVRPDALAALRIRAEPYLLTLPADHRLAGEAEIDVRALRGDTVLVRRHCEALADISSFFTSHGMRPKIAARTTSDERALAFVRLGLGIAIMPASFASPGVVMTGIAGFRRTRDIGVQVLPHNRRLLEERGPVAELCRRLAREWPAGA